MLAQDRAEKKETQKKAQRKNNVYNERKVLTQNGVFILCDKDAVFLFIPTNLYGTQLKEYRRTTG
jgi:hypothetical protein